MFSGNYNQLKDVSDVLHINFQYVSKIWNNIKMKLSKLCKQSAKS